LKSSLRQLYLRDAAECVCEGSAQSFADIKCGGQLALLQEGAEIRILPDYGVLYQAVHVAIQLSAPVETEDFFLITNW
jgi:hypothetical protein